MVFFRRNEKAIRLEVVSMFRISFSLHGDRSFNKAPQDIQQRIIQVLESLADDTFWYRRVKKLQGTENQVSPPRWSVACFVW